MIYVKYVTCKNVLENQSLKEKNEELARVLADTKMEYQKLMQTKLEMHQHLHTADSEKIVSE